MPFYTVYRDAVVCRCSLVEAPTPELAEEFIRDPEAFFPEVRIISESDTPIPNTETNFFVGSLPKDFTLEEDEKKS